MNLSWKKIHIYFHIFISVLVQKSLKLSTMLLFWEENRGQKTPAKKKLVKMQHYKFLFIRICFGFLFFLGRMRARANCGFC